MSIEMRSLAPATICHSRRRHVRQPRTYAPRLILVHEDSEIYAASGLYADTGNSPDGLQPDAGPPVKVSKPQGPSDAVAPSDLAYKDPNPADSVEEKYQKLLKQYGITD